MTKQKSTKRALLMSGFALLMCVSMLIGSTFAWFTDSVTSAGNKIVAGTLKLDLELYDTETKTWNSIKESKAPIFDYDLWEPGYTDVKILKVENEGTLALKWMAKFVSEEELSILADVIDVWVCPSETELTYPSDRNLDGYEKVGTVAQFVNTIEKTTYGSLKADESAYLGIALKMQESAGNDYQGLTLGAFDIQILATQDTVENDSFDNQYDKDAEYPKFDSWDGTADTSWYSDELTEFTLDSAEQFAGLSELVSEGTTFENKTVVLDADLDLGLIAEYAYGKEWNWNVNHEPIGTETSAFMGTFDGQGHVIENAFLNSYIWSNHTNQDMNAIGLFGYVENATIKNVVLKDALAYGEGADFGGIVGKASGDCSFENISIEGSTIAGYNNGSGGIVGEAEAGNYTFKNIVIAEDTVVGTTNQSFDTAIGGLIGQLDENAKVTFEDITVACKLDAYNDVTASQQYWVYRRCGMLIGSVPTVTKVSENGYQPDPATHGVVCKNVTVVFGDWADYHYCADSGAGARYARVEAGYQYAGVDVSTCEDLDEHLNIPFDELFGCQPPVAGAADGISEYTGVTVVNE